MAEYTKDAKRNGKTQNVVHGDSIWRQMIKNELNCASNWKSNWGFMGDTYNNTVTSDNSTTAVKLPPITPPASTLTASSPSNSLFPVSQYYRIGNGSTNDYVVSYQIKRLIRRAGPTEKYILPATSAEEYGWVYGHVKNLELFGKHGRYGRGDITKWFGPLN